METCCFVTVKGSGGVRNLFLYKMFIALFIELINHEIILCLAWKNYPNHFCKHVNTQNSTGKYYCGNTFDPWLYVQKSNVCNATSAMFPPVRIRLGDSCLGIFSVNSQDHKTRNVQYFRTALSVSTNYYKIPKTTANVFLTFRNNVKIFLSQNIMHNF